MSTWEVMSQIARTILIMSVVGSILTMLLFIFKPLVKNRLPKSVQYHLWVLVLVPLLVPFSSFVVIPVNTPLSFVQERIETGVKSTAERQEELAREHYNVSYEELEALEQINISFREIGLMNGEFNNFLLLALITMGWVNFFIEIPQYLVFVIKLRRKRILSKEKETMLLRKLCGEGQLPRLYRNSLAPTPMLIGIFRPVIYLPDKEYTEGQLQNILLHEIIHLRRYDVIVKWVAALVVHVHWFNPLAYFMRRELDRACELSCDEAVIKNLDITGKQSYGDTLIAMAADTKKPKIIVSTTMCEEKKALKERLGAIMKYRKFSVGAIILSCILVVAVICTTIVLGASRPKERTTSVEILIGEFEKEKFEVNLVEFQNSRSENFTYSQRPEILLVNDEEIFVFQYSSRKAVIDDLKLTSDFDKKYTYYNNANILLYRGENNMIIEFLKSKLSVLKNHS